MKKILLSIIVLLGVIGFGAVVSANPSMFKTPVSSASASTTLVYMSPGAATSTSNVIDSYANGDSTAVNQAIVLVQFNASNTTAMKVRVESSLDNVDWYPVNNPIVTSPTATTTNLAAPFSEFVLSFSTSTFAGDFGGSGNASTTVGNSPNARIHQSFTIDTPTRYTRVKFYIPVGGANGGLFYQIQPVKEKPE